MEQRRDQKRTPRINEASSELRRFFDFFGRNSSLCRSCLSVEESLFLLVQTVFFERNWSSSTAIENLAQDIFSVNPSGRARTLAERSVRDYFSSPKSVDFFARLADPFGMIYQQLLSKESRLEKGEFYTPCDLAERITQRSRLLRKERTLLSDPQILDPGCGSGVFLIAALRSFISEGVHPVKALESLFGIDKNPLAVFLTRVQLLNAILRVMPSLRNHEFDWSRIQCGDSILDQTEEFPSIKKTPSMLPLFSGQKFDFILGNPPWLTWDQLTKEYREKTKPYWLRYGLFNLSGKESRYGGAKKELASLMLSVAADRWLRDSGILAMILPLSLFRNRRSGEGFRLFQLGKEGPPLEVLEIEDLSRLDTFPTVQSAPSVLYLQKGKETSYPIPWRCWISPTRSELMHAFPLESSRRGSPLRIVSSFTGEEKCETRNHPNPIDSIYHAQLGANTAGANGIYWLEALEFSENENADPSLIHVRNLVECGKRKIEPVEVWLERELIYPLLRWKDVDTFSAKPSALILLPQDPIRRTGLSEELLRIRYPYTYEYLRRFEKDLVARAAWKKFQGQAPIWSMYNVSEETLRPIKVVWRRMDSRMRAAVVLSDPVSGRPIIPQETLSMVAVDTEEEAVKLATVLNSEETQARIASFSLPGTKSFGAPGLLEILAIRRFGISSNVLFPNNGK